MDKTESYALQQFGIVAYYSEVHETVLTTNNHVVNTVHYAREGQVIRINGNNAQKLISSEKCNSNSLESQADIECSLPELKIRVDEGSCKTAGEFINDHKIFKLAFGFFKNNINLDNGV